jgi:hypothetical protein
VWLVSNDPENPESKRRFLINTKFNIGDKPTSLAFEIKDGKIVFETEPVNVTSNDIFAIKREAPKRHKCGDWLWDFLDAPKPSSVVYEEGAKKDYTKLMIKQAAKERSVIHYFVWVEKKWYMKRPEAKDENLFTEEHKEIFEQNGFKAGPLEL